MTRVRDRIAELRRLDPKLKAVRIAEQLGISRERVRLELMELGLPTNFWKSPWICADCGKPVSYGSRRCRSCNAKSHHTTPMCEMCGKVEEFVLTYAKRQLRICKHHFCSHRCEARWYWHERMNQLLLTGMHKT